MEEIPFEGFMPLSKLLDYLSEQWDKNGDVWVMVKGVIQSENEVERVSENQIVIPGSEGQ